MQLENGAQACNVFWQVGSSVTLDSASTFVGTVMALTSATLDTGATVQGRILARNGAVTLDANTITTPPTCAASTTSATSPVTPIGGGHTSTALGSGATGAIGASGGGSGGTAAGAASGSGSGSASTTVSGATGIVPVGFPHTGLGGAAHRRFDDLIVLGGLALAAIGRRPRDGRTPSPCPGLPAGRPRAGVTRRRDTAPARRRAWWALGIALLLVGAGSVALGIRGGSHALPTARTLGGG